MSLGCFLQGQLRYQAGHLQGMGWERKREGWLSSLGVMVGGGGGNVPACIRGGFGMGRWQCILMERRFEHGCKWRYSTAICIYPSMYIPCQKTLALLKLSSNKALPPRQDKFVILR